MWNLEKHNRERGRSFAYQAPVVREYSCSPPRTPKAPSYTPHGFIILDTPVAYKNRVSYFSPPANSTPATTKIVDADHTHSTLSTYEDSEIPTSDTDTIKTETSGPSIVLERKTHHCEGIKPDVPDLTSFSDTGKSGNEKASVPSFESKCPELTNHSFDEHFDLHMTPRPTYSKKTNSTKRYFTHSTLEPADATKTMYHNARNIGVHSLSKLVTSPKIDIVDGATGEIYMGGVSLHMLEYFCGIENITSRLLDSRHSSQISVPSSHASKDGIIRVVRYMRRWCIGSSNRPVSELNCPPSIKEGIATSLACRFLGLDADAGRLEEFVVKDLLGNPTHFVTDEDVELIWCHYDGQLRDTTFGDAVVWFVLESVMDGTHALAEEVRWMLEQEEYEDLKTCVRDEMKRREWRKLGRKDFLKVCRQDRESSGRAGLC